MKKYLSLVMALVLSLTALCCGAALADDAGTMAVLVPCSVGDPFVALCLRGMEKLEADTGRELRVIETYSSVAVNSLRDALETSTYDYVVASSWYISDVMKDIAPMYPDTTFILTDVYLKTDAPNISSLSVDPYGASFIGGYLAAKKSEVGLVGFIAHADRAVSRRYRDGYVAGVEYANEKLGKNVQVQVAYVGTDQDPVKGSETAIQMIEESKVDVIFQSASLSGMGVISACQEKGVACIGADDYQGDEADVVFWSVLKPFDEVLYNEGLSVVEGTFTAGDKNMGAAQGIALYDDRDFEALDDETKAEVTQIVQDIVDGKIVLAADENVVK